MGSNISELIAATDSQPARTVGRAVQLLKLVASSQARTLRLVDIAAMASLDKSTAQRLLHRLVLERLLVRDPLRGYRLGPLLYELGLGALPETGLQDVARPALIRLAQSTGDVVFLVARSGFETVCLSRIAGDFPIQTMTRTEGDRHPLGVGAGGLALLASLHDADIERIIKAIEPRLQLYHLNRTVLFDAVARTRARGGIAVDDGSAALGITAIGRTVLDRTRTPVASVFIASISHRMKQTRQKQIARQLVACADSIEATLSEMNT